MLNETYRGMLAHKSVIRETIAPFGGNDHIRVLPLMSIEC